MQMPSLSSVANKLLWALKIYFGWCMVMSVFYQISVLVVVDIIVMPLYVLYRPAYQWLFQRVSETYMLFYPFVFYYICGNRVVETGDSFRVNENAIIISNHTHFYDFIPTVLAAPRAGRIGAMRFFMKDDIRKIPFIGFGFWLMDSIYLKRDFETDKPFIMETFKRFRNKYYPFWLTIYPEGTRVKPQKLREAQEFAAHNGLPTLNNLLNPRPKGFTVSLQTLRHVVPAVYDVTIGYPIKPTPACVFCFNEGITFHTHIRRIPTSEIPDDPEEIHEWLTKLWVEKDELMSYFKTHHNFPGDSRTPPMEFHWADFTGYMSKECFSLP